MASDATTFFLGFAAIFGVLGWYLWHLERKVDDMRKRLDAATPRHPREGAGPSPQPPSDRRPRGEHPQRVADGGPSGPRRDGTDARPKNGQPEEWP